MTSRTLTTACGFGVFLGVVLISTTAPKGSVGQDSPKKKAASTKRFDTLEALNSAYEKEYREISRRQLTDLTALASRQAASKAEIAYQQIFQLAVARDQYEDAARAAEDYLAGEREGPQLKALATLVDAIAKADRREDEKALAGIERFLKTQRAEDKTARLEAKTIFDVGEAFLQRLIRAGRYDTAKKACDLILKEDPDKAVRDHFAARLTRLNLVGKPAPPIAGVDVEGKQISLHQYKGKVILVDFWATWYPPSQALVPVYRELLKRYQDKGFAILGVNVDSSHPETKGDLNKVKPVVKRFVEQLKVTWPSVYNGAGIRDYAKLYGVGNLPATFLIGKDGTVLHVEQYGSNLDQVVAEALGDEKSPKDR